MVHKKEQGSSSRPVKVLASYRAWSITMMRIYHVIHAVLRNVERVNNRKA
jgi:hypothetical protein